MKAADITDEQFLAAVDEAIRLAHAGPSPWSTASRRDVTAVLAGHPEDIGGTPVDYPDMPAKVVLAKARKLIRRKVLDGCECGCRGNWAQARTGGP